MNDPTEEPRKFLTRMLNALVESDDKAAERARLEGIYTEVWDTTQLQEEFEVKSFLAPFVMVTRKSTGKAGVLQFQDKPRFYFEFQET